MIEHYFTAKDLSKVNNTVADDQIENYGITVTTTPIEYDAEPMEKAISELCNKLEDTLLYGSTSKDNKDIGSSDQPFEEKEIVCCYIMKKNTEIIFSCRKFGWW